MLRSLLFVPSDSERKLARSIEVDADVFILDLEDSVLPPRKPLARTMMRKHLDGIADHGRWWVRINDLTSGEVFKDLVATVPARPAGILIPKVTGPEDVTVISHYLDVLEAEHEVEPGSIGVAVVVTETPTVLLRMGDLVKVHYPRVKAVLWGAEDLSAALQAGDPRTAKGEWRPPYEYARSQSLLLAHAWGVAAIDSVYVDFRDTAGLAKSCDGSRRDGFTGRVAIHPAQVDIINKAYSHHDADIALARQIVAAFAVGEGAIAIDGRMYDIPHLKAARQLIASHDVGRDRD